MRTGHHLRMCSLWAIALARAWQYSSPAPCREMELERGIEPQNPRGVVLLAPFSSIEALLDMYYIMGLVPLLAPLRIFPFLSGGPLLLSFAYLRKNRRTCAITKKLNHADVVLLLPGFFKRFLVERYDTLSKITVQSPTIPPAQCRII